MTMVSSTVASVPMTVATISGLSISRPLAVVAVMSIGVRRSIPVTVSSVSVAMAVVAISRLGSGGGLSISLSLSISGPLAVVVSSVASIASTVPSIPVPTAVVAIAGLGGNNSEEDDGESNQKFHVVRSSFST